MHHLNIITVTNLIGGQPINLYSIYFLPNRNSPNLENPPPRKPTDAWSFMLNAIRAAQMPTACFSDDPTFATNGCHFNNMFDS